MIAPKLTWVACLVGALALLPAGAAAQGDTTPPVLASMEFSPGVVNVSAGDGQVTVRVRLTDELSGVSYAYMYFFSPSRQQYVYIGFGPGNRVSGNEWDGVYEATATVRQYSEGGTWHADFLWVYDTVGNGAGHSTETLADRGFPTALSVEGGVDLAPPQVQEFSFAPGSVDVASASAPVTVRVRLTDNVSGVSYAYVYFFSPSRQQYVYIGFGPGNRTSGNEKDGIYETTASIRQFSEGGTWHADFLWVYDAVGNGAGHSTEALAAEGFSTELIVQPEPGDITPPRLQEFSFAPRSVDVAGAPAPVNVRVRLTDELSGVSYAYVYFFSPSRQQYVYIGFGPGNRVSGDERDGVYEATASIRQFSEAGTWHADFLWVYDSVGNGSGHGTDVLAALGFPVELGVNVNAPPVADAGPNRTAIVGESLTFEGSGSADPDGTIASYSWDFGDGAAGVGLTTAHAYATAGTFIVALTVTDDDGATATDETTVTVQTPAAAVSSLQALVGSYNLKAGVASALTSKLENVAAALVAGNAAQRADAANRLGAFINAVEAQRGKALTPAQADELIALARRIVAAIG